MLQTHYNPGERRRCSEELKKQRQDPSQLKEVAKLSMVGKGTALNESDDHRQSVRNKFQKMHMKVSGRV